MKKIFIPLIILIAYSFNSSAQENWSLTKCIDKAYENNIKLKQSQLTLKASQNNSFQNKLDMLPSLNANASHAFNFGRSISFASNTYQNENYQNSNFSLSANAVLFNGFKKCHTYKKSLLDIQVKEKDIEIYKSNLAINIAGLYLQVLLKLELVNISKEQLSISKEQETKITRLVEAGKLAEIEILKQKAIVSQDDLALVEAENGLELAYIDLYQVMDIKDENRFKIDVLEAIVVDANRSFESSSSLYERALDVRPELAKSLIDIQYSKRDLSIAKASLTPTLSASAGWNSGYADNYKNPVTREKEAFFTQIDNNASKNIRLNLSIPIFNGFQASTSVRNSRLQLENAKFEQENTKNTLRKEIEQVYSNAKAAMKKYYSAKIATDYSRESFDFSKKKYDAGLIDLVSYKEIKKEYVSSASKFLQAKYDYVFRTKILDYYVGLPLSL